MINSSQLLLFLLLRFRLSKITSNFLQLYGTKIENYLIYIKKINSNKIQQLFMGNCVAQKRRAPLNDDSCKKRSTIDTQCKVSPDSQPKSQDRRVSSINLRKISYDSRGPRDKSKKKFPIEDDIIYDLNFSNFDNDQRIMNKCSSNLQSLRDRKISNDEALLQTYYQKLEKRNIRNIPKKKQGNCTLFILQVESSDFIQHFIKIFFNLRINNTSILRMFNCM
ncbi:hypothetical protein pb186bvf_002823 [Paramecium bursaria]